MCRRIRWKKCSIPPARAIRSRAGSWRTWRAVTMWRRPICAAPWSSAPRWGHSPSSAFPFSALTRSRWLTSRPAWAISRTWCRSTLRGSGCVAGADHYRAAGVDLDQAEQAKRRIAELVKSTRTKLTRGLIGAFGGMVKVPKDVRDPTLVLSTDGVGTKVLVAIAANRHDTVGECLVNHCVNDILVHGAKPIAFLDYIAAAQLHTPTV